MRRVFFFLFPVIAISSPTWTYSHDLNHTGINRNSSSILYGNRTRPSLDDFNGISTPSRWFETTLGGLSLFEQPSVMNCLATTFNGSLIDVQLRDQPVTHVVSKLWSLDSPNTVWLSAIWDATFHGPLMGVDYTPLADNLFSQIVGVSNMVSDCQDAGMLDLQRTFGARFNTPNGPETRIFSLRDLKMVYPTYPGVGVKELWKTNDGSIILDPEDRCLDVWQAAS